MAKTDVSSPSKIGKTFHQAYVEAAWGLKNHWYPALFSNELADGAALGVEIAGVPIVLRRSKGVVYALKDECVHRGVKLSARPMCLTDETITCWYHGFTYRLTDGVVSAIVAAPKDEMVGKARIQVFPVEEINGMIFVFVGDEGYKPVPNLADDLSIRRPADYEFRTAHPLDKDAVLLGIHRTVGSNWRLAAENGIDPGHVMIHRDNAIVLSREMGFPLGEVPKSPQAVRFIEQPDGPKGVEYLLDSEFVEFALVNEELGLSNLEIGHNPLPGLRTVLYLPCLLAVENWPTRGVVQYEWYVPVDDKTHEYWQVLAMNCPDEKSRRDFEFKYEHMWKKLGLRDFNDHDIFARVAMQPFYEKRNGWYKEQLFSLDRVLVAWREAVTRHNRGIQSPPG